MAAGLGFKDFQTGEVLTAADVDGYLMQGVWVFASAAARDAAVTSPQEGNFAYLKDTNVTTYYTGSAWTNLDTTGMTNPMTTTGDIIYSSPGSTPVRLGIGSTGNVLTVASGVPSWSAPAGGGGMTLLSTTTLSGSSTSISITPTGYNQIAVFVSGVTNGSNGNLFMGINSDTTSGNYVQAFYGTEGTAYYSGANIGVAGVNAIVPGVAGYLGSNSANFAQFVIYDPNGSTRKVINASSAFFSNSSLNAASNTTCNFVTTSALSSIQLKTTVGSFTAGTCLVYGVK
jgi:hypothetical protein